MQRYNTALIMAAHIEAKPFIDNLGLKEIERSPFQVFASDEHLLVISGIGKTLSALAVQYAVMNYSAERLINLGSCGALNSRSSIGDVYQISKIWESDRPSIVNRSDRFLFPDNMEGIETRSIACQDIPAVKRDEREKLSAKADLVDMESAGFMQAVKLHKKSGYIFKLVTDTPEEEKDKDILENIRKYRDSLFQFVSTKNILTKRSDET